MDVKLQRIIVVVAADPFLEAHGLSFTATHRPRVIDIHRPGSSIFVVAYRDHVVRTTT